MQPTKNVEFTASPDLQTLIDVFNRVLGEPYRTLLVGGADEPLYEPGDKNDRWARICFTRDYFSSALHEVAHWCVAGEDRRKRRDYGYWYQPDGRNERQQKEFERVEVAPQALEWIFSVACGVKFRISADNLNGKVGASGAFRTAVWQKVQEHCLSRLGQNELGQNEVAQKGLDERARIFTMCLAETFFVEDPLNKNKYKLADI